MTGHVVVAPDKFKGTLTAAGVAAAVALGLRDVRPDLDVRRVPVADGGDGTVDIAVAAGFTRVVRRVAGPTGTPVEAAFAVRGDTAVVEVAAASGLALLDRPAPLTATSRGAGELLRSAYELGCRRLVLGVGGSACTDGGAGMLDGLDGLDLRDAELVLATDVDNPLLGPLGAAAVYGPQKGATPDQVEELEARLRAWADRIGPSWADHPGAGAAGGVGFAALAVLGATRRPGIDVVLELVGFADHLPGARLVVTGEGSLDDQTAHGKAPAGVARAAGGVPVVAVAGRCTVDPVGLGIDAAYALTDVEPDPDRCLREPAPILRRLAGRIAADRLVE